MDISIAASVVVLIIGIILYFVAPGPKPQEAGRLMFFAGLFVTLLKVGHVALLHG